ncbi:hypothetical protein ACU686_16545 [Yinghuangia aomiensis]
MPPAHPYPAALDDRLAVSPASSRRARPGGPVRRWGSAGGSLAAALVLRARDEDSRCPPHSSC